MRIDIIVTRDDGSTITIGSNIETKADPKAPTGARLWNLRTPTNPRTLTQDETWAASFLCGEMALRVLPISARNVPLMKAAVAYDEPSDRQRGEDEERGRMSARNLAHAFDRSRMGINKAHHPTDKDPALYDNNGDVQLTDELPRL